MKLIWMLPPNKLSEKKSYSQIVHHIMRVNQLSAQVPAQACSVLSLFLQNLFYKTPNL
jgi:hypothetical protein